MLEVILWGLLIWSGIAYLFAVIAWPHIAEHIELLNKDLEWVQNASVGAEPSSVEND